MDLTILPTGSLELRLPEDERDDLRANSESGGELYALLEATERYWTNGGFQPFDGGEGNPFVGLTSAPCIAESLTIDDEGRKAIEGRLWWFPDYAVVSVVDELLKYGRLEFPAAPEPDMESKPETISRRRRTP